MHYEVEQKFAIDAPEPVVAKLAALGASAAGSVRQCDQYFAHPCRDFAQTDEALRVRSTGDENRVTYKGPKLDAATKTRNELEFALQPGQSGRRQFAELLLALGFRPVAEVRKRRAIYELTFRNRPVEAVVDEVEDVGLFMELETSADEAELTAARECIIALAAELGLAASERRSYLELLLVQLGKSH